MADLSGKTPCSGPSCEESTIYSGQNSSRNHSTKSYYSIGRDFYDDNYSSDGEEDSIQDRLDFAYIQVPGREKELAQLHKVFHYATVSGVKRSRSKNSSQESSVVIIKGASGTGKSSLVKKFVDDITMSALNRGAKAPFFVSGKYDELSGADPFSAIVDAFSVFSTELLEGDEKELKRIRGRLRESLGSEVGTLTAVIPSLRMVIGDETIAMGPKENAWNKLKYIFQLFATAISTTERPVVMFLDDLQWCDSASMELMQALLTNQDLRNFMFIGAYRSEDVDDDDELFECLDSIDRIQPIQEMELLNLSVRDLNTFVMDILKRTSTDETRELTEVIYGKSSGNIFHAIQVLEELQRKQVLEFSRMTFQWEWQLDNIDLDELLSDDVIEAVTEKIKSACKSMQRLLILASYTRSSVDVRTLQKLLEMDDSAIPYPRLIKMMDQAVVDGLLTNSMGSEIYSFSHDRIQQAAYGLVPPGKERDDLRLALGHRLYTIGCSEEGEDWMLFTAADHLNATAFQQCQKDPMFLIRINMHVGKRAAVCSAYETASKYLGLAMQALLRLRKPWEEHYDITLDLYSSIADVEFCQGHFVIGKGIGDKVLRNAKTIEDKLGTQMSLVKAIGREERHAEATDMCIELLRSLDAFPKNALRKCFRFLSDFVSVKRKFIMTSDSDYLALPPMEDKRTKTVMQLLSVGMYHSYYCGRTFDFLIFVHRMLRLTSRDGFCGQSGVALMGYCLFCNTVNDMVGALRFASLAREVLTLTKARELECLQVFIFTHWVLAWKAPHEEVLKTYEQGIRVGMESGDFENGLLTQTSSCHHEFVAGYPLGPLLGKFQELRNKLSIYQLESIEAMTIEQLLPVQCLRDGREKQLNIKQLEEFGPRKNDPSENYRLLYGYIARIQLAVYFNEYEFAEKVLEKFSAVQDFDVAFGTKSLRFCFCSLACASLYKITRKRKYLKKARSLLRQLKWLCKNKGTNSWHRCMLMEAHLRGVEGRKGVSAQASYDHAIGAAMRSQQIQDAALGAQLAAEYFLGVHHKDKLNGKFKENLVREYLVQARDLYLQWGALALVGYLEEKHSDYLRPTATLKQMIADSQSDSSQVSSQVAMTQTTADSQPRMSLPPQLISENKSQSGRDEVSILTGDLASWK